MTANAMPEQRKTCISAGMNSFIAKPVQSADLAKSLLECPLVAAEAIAANSDAGASNISKTDSNVIELSEQVESTVAPDQSPTDDDVIDAQVWQNLLEMAGAEKYSLIDDMVATYLEDSQQNVEKIREAIAAKSSESLYFAAHALKGASRYLGAQQLSDFCLTLERYAKAEDFSQAETLAPIVIQQYEAVTTELKLRRENLIPKL